MSQPHKTPYQRQRGASDVISAVFFDMGSTLARLRPSWQGVYHQVFQQAGLDLPLDEVEAAVSYSWDIVASQDPHAEYLTSLDGNRAWQREIEERVMARLNIRPEVREEVFWHLIEAFESPASYELYPDAIPVLAGLQTAGYRLAIISNWSWHLPDLCAALGLTTYFEQIFTSARIGFPKPRPEIFQQALNRLNLQAPQVVHIGDSWQADILGARAVGIEALWLVRPEEQLQSRPGILTPGETNRISDLYEVLAFLGLRG